MNAFSHEMISAVTAALDAADGAGAIVLTGNQKKCAPVSPHSERRRRPIGLLHADDPSPHARTDAAMARERQCERGGQCEVKHAGGARLIWGSATLGLALVILGKRHAPGLASAARSSRDTHA